ncbi:DUF7336 domain-containing protein [Conchiformibius kuhniae]|uniref:DUF7336 domain-containing protein n=1 Tax=Conchiformibius kuhniae TaxID=211502 RepID=A0A8T9MU28_9NEIS|nr:hypothetical protein [Conchiformibius kuhniae]UOP04335.1 hypothetical protein LVJ77_08245 [Conchiformibius kuhniae]
MKYVFLLGHVRQRSPYHDDIKHIGVFATLADARHAQAQLSDKPGFRDYPDGFYIDKCEIGRINWSDGFFNWYTEFAKPQDGAP